MNKMLRFGTRRLILGLLCGVAISLATGEARAENISMTVVANGTPINVDLLTSGGSSTSYGTVNLSALNSLLLAAGSAYQFSALGGSSNWSGSSTGGLLQLNGGIFIPAGGTGNTSLTITETESGFTSPIGVTGLVSSSSTGNFNDAGPGNSHSAASLYNSTTTPTYLVSSTRFGPDPEIGFSSAGISAFTTPFSLTNSISFSLVPSDGSSPQDGFSVAANASLATVPEPAAVVSILSGLPLLILAWFRRQ